jgi:nucleoside-diphosphate-sugar epimerase
VIVSDLRARLDSYAGRRVLVTGGASFIGSHLVELLARSGAVVTVADDLSSGRLENVRSVADDCAVLIGDLRDADFARRAVAGQHTVFHLAASHGGRGYIDTHPVECCNNLVLDHVVFQAAASAGARRLVLASSACVYPTSLQDSDSRRSLLREDQCGFEGPSQGWPDGEYGWAKLTGEVQLRAFHKQYGTDAVACRLFTAYGERENESHAVIALIAKALAKLDPYPIWGDGSQTRNFTYVGDTVTGLALAGASTEGFDVVNVGTPVHTPINELIEEIFAATGFWPSAVDRQLDMPVGVKSRAADCTKNDRLWDWHPSTSLAEGIKRTVGWYAGWVPAERLDSLEEHLMSR